MKTETLKLQIESTRNLLKFLDRCLDNPDPEWNSLRDSALKLTKNSCESIANSISAHLILESLNPKKAR